MGDDRNTAYARHMTTNNPLSNDLQWWNKSNQIKTVPVNHHSIHYKSLIFNIVKFYFIVPPQVKLKISFFKLPWKNSCGYDEIPIKILKISVPFISSPLCYIINKLSTGVFPIKLKYSVIIPVYKKGDRNNVSNFRPLSLL
jgi:hypothetical protein